MSRLQWSYVDQLLRPRNLAHLSSSAGLSLGHAEQLSGRLMLINECCMQHVI